MIVKWQTKTDINGNTYCLAINTIHKCYKVGYGVGGYGCDFKVTKGEINSFVSMILKPAGYREVK